MKAVIFDLDNTLYAESLFVQSGFRAVAAFLEQRYGVPTGKSQAIMEATMDADGRGAVFDTLVTRLSLTDVDPKLLVWLYRSHAPDIEPFPETASALDTLKSARVATGVLTDGIGSVQHRKLDALALGNALDAVMVTDELGQGFGKPHTSGFEFILEALDVSPKDAVYVGDDPRKDFIAPNQLGMGSILVRRELKWPFAGEADTIEAEPQHTVASLTEAAAVVLPQGTR